MLSIVIPCHKRFDLLQACLATVMRFRPADSEVVVVDDGSPGQQAAGVAAKFEAVRVIQRSTRGGFCQAANAGIAASRGDVLELLNDDTEVTAGWAESALSWFDDPRIGAVAPLVLTWPEARTIDSAGDCYYIGGVARKRGHGKPIGDGYLEPRPVFGASASSAFYRRQALDRVGPFPESFGAYFEDVDLAFRLQRAGYRTMFEPRSRVLHHTSASHGTASGDLIAQQSRNEERVFWRNLPGADLLRALPAHLAVVAGKAYRRWREGNLLPFLRGRLSTLGEVRELLRHRRRLIANLPAENSQAWHLDRTWWET